LEPLFGFSASLRIDGEHYVPGGIGISQQRELPSKLVKSGPQGIHGIAQAKRNRDWDRLKFTPQDMALVQDSECIRLMRDFLAAKPELWKEDIGV
jgi:hypothetical protein